MSTYLGNKVLAWMRGTAFPAVPAACYVGLFDGTPKSGGDEITNLITGTAVRPSITFEALSGGSDNIMANSAIVDFGNSAGTVANMDWVGIFDDPDVDQGNLLWAKLLTGGPYVVAPGTPVSFAIGGLQFTCGD